jgi:hypothetical protein
MHTHHILHFSITHFLVLFYFLGCHKCSPYAMRLRPMLPDSVDGNARSHVPKHELGRSNRARGANYLEVEFPATEHERPVLNWMQ